MWLLEVLCELGGMVGFGVVVWILYFAIFVMVLRIGLLSVRATTVVLAVVPILTAGAGVLIAHGLILKLLYAVIGLSPELMTLIWVKSGEA